MNTSRFMVVGGLHRAAWVVLGLAGLMQLLAVPVAAMPAEDLREARAHWLAEDTIAWRPAVEGAVRLHFSLDAPLEPALIGNETVELRAKGIISGDLLDKYPHLAGTPVFQIPRPALELIPAILRGHFVVSAVGPHGGLLDATALQPAGVLDDLYAHDGDLGVVFENGVPSLRVWAPTARAVRLLLFDDSGPGGEPVQSLPMQRGPATGTWSIEGRADWDRKFYLYEVEVFVRRTGRFELNRVTDPYSHGLATDSRRSQIVDLSDEDLLPANWQVVKKPALDAHEDIVLYELHVRDFSIDDALVPPRQRGTFAAFSLDDSHGLRHLDALAASGLTHVHLLPAFDCATIPEDPASRLSPPALGGFASDSPRPQEEIGKVRARDAFNWCYDPFHYTVPEGSYATDPDGVTRIREFRGMVTALNARGLRVVMDVVYNHTPASGQAVTSVLDRIVPDYYQRLDAQGRVETSTCCANTASENAMMEKLMLDSLLTWARHYRIDGFRFDLMGHHSRGNIEKARDALQALSLEQDGVDGRAICLYGEGWNFGEVADDARFVQASQARMGMGSGVGTFNDRLRDAVRGGAHDDRGLEHVRSQGFANGLYTDPNRENEGGDEERLELLQLTDLVRAGLAGSLRDYRFINHRGLEVAASEIDYHGQGAAYASDPQEVINYVAAHDNETLFDINQYKLPLSTSMDDRVRAVNLANSIVALAQGVPFFHAGQDMLRSKSLDRNSYDSGDWFNQLDFSYRDNGWPRGLPPAWDNEANWLQAGPLLARPELAPAPRHIRAAVTHLREVLKIRKSSPLFRLRDAAAIRLALRFHNTGPEQLAGLIVMSLEDERHGRFVVLFNTSPQAQTFPFPHTRGYELHPVQQASADPVVRTARHDPRASVFEVPGRTTAVFISRTLPGSAFP
ncbi:MAG: pullulanase-type alpha-1,6-glucosidase [Xanthomonadales bacterium]|nr:pullulanase-type alpha-1,6-glucosidase [Gammaproteobacteria bacterium]MBT8049949.1 pullulanase-type alpha-1,6-glucosidase [Gammaproteobacteria bacterium]MBT8055512.1 pullulanase-type alpha-1,6-glucosidase [Gammaproteobacteria bacterium]NNJ78371.1 pullulanase-type alpha-1,6-glucosidase [Xanthomonadales bacterium]NNL03670.1 pullulanase-type alpha-1,6-glucosidase [Xanthomonadales bacterium]